MFRIVRTATRDGWRDAAERGVRRAEGAAAEVALSKRHACEARAAQVRAEARYKELKDDTLAGIARLEIKVRDPRQGPSFQAELALAILRGQMEKIKESGDRAAIMAIRACDHMLSEGAAFDQAEARRDAAAQQDETPKVGNG